MEDAEVQKLVLFLFCIAGLLMILASYYRLRAYFSAPERSSKGSLNYPHDYDVGLMTETKKGRAYYRKYIRVAEIFVCVAAVGFLIAIIAEEVYHYQILSYLESKL